jgi:hypothetical protein
MEDSGWGTVKTDQRESLANRGAGKGKWRARPPAPKASERAQFPEGKTHILKALKAIIYRESRAL